MRTKMRRLAFYDYEELACAMADEFDSLKGSDWRDVVFVGYYDAAKQVVTELINMGYELISLDIAAPTVNGYENEYIVSLCEGEVWCEPMKRENGYLNDEAHVAYVMDDCSSEVLKHLEGAIAFEVSVGEDEDEEWDEDNCLYCDEYGCKFHAFNMRESVKEGVKAPEPKKAEPKVKAASKPAPKEESDYITDKDGSIHGFTVTKNDDHGESTWKMYSSNPMSDKEIDRIMKQLGI